MCLQILSSRHCNSNGRKRKSASMPLAGNEEQEWCPTDAASARRALSVTWLMVRTAIFWLPGAKLRVVRAPFIVKLASQPSSRPEHLPSFVDQDFERPACRRRKTM